MSSEERMVLYVIVGILLLVGIISFVVYETKEIRINNFEKTIESLSEEQKCLHICGFEWHGWVENYKFCVEKCDRISERKCEELR